MGSSLWSWSLLLCNPKPFVLLFSEAVRFLQKKKGHSFVTVRVVSKHRLCGWTSEGRVGKRAVILTINLQTLIVLISAWCWSQFSLVFYVSPNFKLLQIQSFGYSVSQENKSQLSYWLGQGETIVWWVHGGQWPSWSVLRHSANAFPS